MAKLSKKEQTARLAKSKDLTFYNQRIEALEKASVGEWYNLPGGGREKIGSQQAKDSMLSGLIQQRDEYLNFINTSAESDLTAGNRADLLVSGAEGQQKNEQLAETQAMIRANRLAELRKMQMNKGGRLGTIRAGFGDNTSNPAGMSTPQRMLAASLRT